MSVINEMLVGLVCFDSVYKCFYIDFVIFVLEMEWIYGCVWIYVGYESQVKMVGDYYMMCIGDQDVVMVCVFDGMIYVIYNWCLYKGVKVVFDGDGLVGKFFWCLYYVWIFRYDGMYLLVLLCNGLQNICFDLKYLDFLMCCVVCVDSYCGFVFVSQSDDGLDLWIFLNGVMLLIDNLCDCFLVGEVEVMGGVFCVLQCLNWKVFYENLYDMMYVLVMYELLVMLVCVQVEEMGVMLFELFIMDGNGELYEFWEKLELCVYVYGYGYMEGIFDLVVVECDLVLNVYFVVFVQVYGDECVCWIFGMNCYNIVIYGSGFLYMVFQQFCVICLIVVDWILVEIQLFCLKGVFDVVFDCVLIYVNVINLLLLNVMLDDVEVYVCCQEGNQICGGEWVSMYCYVGMDCVMDDGFVLINGISELLMCNQFVVWKCFMVDEVVLFVCMCVGDV